ncbi:MAG: hypothetical protein J0J04_00100 [Microbacterium sp.]|nr:hypothetical protein [Microbacterium sp.]
MRARWGASASVLTPSVTGMLRALEPGRSRPYAVPWQIDRRDEAHPVVRNSSAEPADFVRVFRSDGASEHWGQVLPGEDVAMCLCDADLDAVVITVAWYRWRTDEEYCWRFVL